MVLVWVFQKWKMGIVSLETGHPKDHFEYWNIFEGYLLADNLPSSFLVNRFKDFYGENSKQKSYKFHQKYVVNISSTKLNWLYVKFLWGRTILSEEQTKGEKAPHHHHHHHPHLNHSTPKPHHPHKILC